MKIVVTGSLGHIGKPLIQELVHQGHAVTVVSSKAEKQPAIEKIGAKAAIGTIEDLSFLVAAFKGADAVYTMLPPPDFSNPNFDLMGSTRKLSDNYAQAIKQAHIKRVVHLSSIGAHLPKGTGLILLHRQAEDILSKVSDANITFMRPVGFYYNLYSFLASIKGAGTMVSNYGAEDKIPWVSPLDIASAIVEEVVTPLVGTKIRYVASDEVTCNAVARTLGAAIGKPDMKWSLVSNEQQQTIFESFGMRKDIAAGLIEMQACMHNGPFYDDYYANKPALGKIKISDFAKEFAAIYKQR